MQPALAELNSSSTRTKLASNTFLSCEHSSFHSAVEVFDDSSPNPRKSVLVVGATGRTGTACIQALAEQAQDQVAIHAFCRDPSTLRLEIAVLCDSVHTGDARNPRDLQRAMDRTRADTVLICVGSRAHEGRPTARTDNAHAMVQVVKGFSHHHHHHHHGHRHHRHTSRGSRDRDNTTHTYDHVHIIVLSHSGSQAQPTRQRRVRNTNKRGSSQRYNHHSMRKVFHRCHVDHRVLEDHWGQENHFMTLKSQTTVVRPTVLTQGSPKGHISSVCKASTSSSSAQLQLDQVLGGSANSSSMERRQSSSLLIEMTDLVDLADWMVQEVLTQRHQGQTVNVCSRRHSQHDHAEPTTATQ